MFWMRYKENNFPILTLIWGPDTVQFLYNAMFGSICMDRVISEWCYKGTILQRNYRKNVHFSLSFSHSSLKNSRINKFGSHNITVVYPNLCYNKMCYKGTALCIYFHARPIYKYLIF